MEIKTILIIIAILIGVFSIYGFYGGMQVEDAGVDCVIGLNDGKTFCWQWEKNTLGELQDVGESVKQNFKGLTGGVIRE